MMNELQIEALRETSYLVPHHQDSPDTVYIYGFNNITINNGIFKLDFPEEDKKKLMTAVDNIYSNRQSIRETNNYRNLQLKYNSSKVHIINHAGKKIGSVVIFDINEYMNRLSYLTEHNTFLSNMGKRIRNAIICDCLQKDKEDYQLTYSDESFY